MTVAQTIVDEFAIHAARYDATSPPLTVESPLVTFLRERLKPGSRIVEFGIGTGRVAIPLLQAGFDVTGIEVSPDMQARLAEKPAADQLTVVAGSFAEPHDIEACDAVVCVYNTLYHAHDLRMQQAALRCAAGYLKPGGLVVLENRSAASLVREYERGERLSVRRVETGSAWFTAGTVCMLTQVARIVHMSVSGAGNVSYHPITLRYIWPGELRLLADLADLEVTEEFADWHGSAFTAESREHIVVLRRAIYPATVPSSATDDSWGRQPGSGGG